MPAYDCGNPDCIECAREFGPDRREAIKRFEFRSRGLSVVRAPSEDGGIEWNVIADWGNPRFDAGTVLIGGFPSREDAEIALVRSA